MTAGARFRAYQSYRRSRVPWAERVPAHWADRRSDAVLTVEKRQLDPAKFADQQVFHYSIPAVQEYGDGQVEEGGNLSSGKLAIDSRVVLVSKLNPRKATVVLAYPREELTLASTEFVPLNATRCYDAYLCYLMSSEGFRQFLDARVQSVTKSHQRVNPEDIAKFHFAWPSEGEQRAIAAFLDRETARIDALIETKRRLIEVLQEKRTAVIAAAVTKGLDRNAPLRDSGIAWLGMIPRHWNLQRFKHVTTRVDVGIAEAATHAYADEGVPLVRSTDVLPNELRTSGLLTIEPWFARRNRSKSLHRGDLVTVRTGAPGTTAVVPEELDGCQCFTLLMSTVVGCHHSPYFCYYLNSAAAVTYFQLVGWGTAQINISVPILKEAPVPVPPLSEQREISEACRLYERRFGAAISAAEEAVDRLTEYRSALISAAVTGQIDVREVA